MAIANESGLIGSSKCNAGVESTVIYDRGEARKNLQAEYADLAPRQWSNHRPWLCKTDGARSTPTSNHQLPRDAPPYYGPIHLHEHGVKYPRATI